MKLKKYCFIIKLRKKMKKLVLLLAVVFGASLVSCGGAKTEAAAEVADSVAVVDSVCADSCCADTVAADTVAADSVK